MAARNWAAATSRRQTLDGSSRCAANRNPTAQTPNAGREKRERGRRRNSTYQRRERAAEVTSVHGGEGSEGLYPTGVAGTQIGASSDRLREVPAKWRAKTRLRRPERWSAPIRRARDRCAEHIGAGERSLEKNLGQKRQAAKRAYLLPAACPSTGDAHVEARMGGEWQARRSLVREEQSESLKTLGCHSRP